MSETTSWVPDGVATVTAYVCPRECAAAIAWYVEVLAAQEEGERYVDPDGRIGHATVRIGDTLLMLSDAYPDYGAEAPGRNASATFALQVYVPDADAVVAAAKRAGAVVQRPVEEQFHGARMGTLVDPFGVRWMGCTQVRDVGSEELERAAGEFATTGAPEGAVGPLA